MFTTDLPEKIRQKLKADNPKFKISDNYINGLKCPACGKVEGFAHLDKPFAILCHRNNECGVNTPTKSIYPELWANLSKDYPPTEADPKATARAYLESRGLNPDSIEFKQGKVYDRDTKREYPSLVIEHDSVICQRLIDYNGKDKTRLNEYAGKVFETTSALNPDCDTVFVVEGVIDALSLEQFGKAAISTYSSGSIPKDWYQANCHKKIVLAFDNDAAGIKGIQKTIDYFKENGIKQYTIALAPKGKDWNSLLVNGQLDDKAIDRAYWQGKLTFAKSAKDYFEIYISGFYENDNLINSASLIFEFNGWIYKGWQVEKSGEIETKIKALTDCTIRLLHSVIDDSQDDKQRMEHYVEVESTREGKGRIRLDATELVRLDAFKSALQNHRQLFFGNGDDLTALVSYLFKPKPPKIRALSSIGFDEKSKAFVFPKFMYDKDGRRIDANSDKYFEAANIKPFMDCSDPIISRLDNIDLKQFIENLHGAYGEKGLLSLGFYIASLFSNTIFDHYGFFPFLSLYGDPHAGKSFVSKLLNKCLFVDSEGQTMTKANTAKGELRKISQKSSLVCALLEGRKDGARFDYDSILPLYNRNALYSRATTSQDNRTHDLPLKAAISFVWNYELFTLKAAKERVISYQFKDADLNETTSKFWAELNNYSPEQLASVGHYLLTNRQFFEGKLVKNSQVAATKLKEAGINVTRIAENHAIPLIGISALIEHLGIAGDLYIPALSRYTVQCARHKLETAKNESHIADYFLESIRDLNSMDGVIVKDGLLIVHLPSALSKLQESGNGFNNKKELIEELRRHDRFVESKNTRALGGQKECLHFRE